jgi:hypothetical protein
MDGKNIAVDSELAVNCLEWFRVLRRGLWIE